MARPRNSDRNPVSTLADRDVDVAVAEPETPQDAAPAVEMAAPDTNTAIYQIMLQLMSKINELEGKVNAAPAAKPAEDLGPPPLPRSQRPHIMVWKDPFTTVRAEVSEEVAAAWRAGGKVPVKGYQNHAHTIRTR